MDPLVITSGQPPLVFFMTRADIFTPLLKPILWASQMLPIYRQLDGQKTKDKNEKVFKKCNRILKYGRSLLIFSEGFTDDVFIRRLKPVKKGAVRIGFGALEDINWSKNIYIQTIGINYSDPNHIGGDCVISNGESICLNNYQEAYKNDPNKVVHELSSQVEMDMRDQLTDVRNKEMAPFHENIMRITRKGMNAIDSDHSIPLLQRYKYSKQLAHWFNENKIEEDDDIMELKQELETYFTAQKKASIKESNLYIILKNKRHKLGEYLFLTLVFPFVLVGLVHHFLPYILIKRFVEKSFKRKVFWGSVKMMLGAAAITLFNLPIIFIGYHFIFPSALLWLAYYFVCIPLVGALTYNWFNRLKQHKQLNRLAKKDMSDFVFKRQELVNKIRQLIPVA